MIKPERFKAPWIAPSDIRKIVEGLRAKYPVCAQLPVEILSFAEHDLHLEFDFKPIAQFGQDAFLLHDFSGIVFDDHAFDCGFRSIRTPIPKYSDSVPGYSDGCRSVATLCTDG